MTLKHEKWISCLVGMALAFLLSFGAMGCLVTAFDLDTGMTTLGLGCGLASLCGGCYLLKRGDAILTCVCALGLGYLWRRGTLITSFETLAYIISRRYDSGYGCGILGQPSGTVTAALLICGGLIALVAVRSVCRRDTSFPGLTLALLPLLLCVVVTDTVPNVRYLFILLLGMILVLLTGSLRRSDPAQANTLTAMALIPGVIGLSLLFWLVPKESYVNRMDNIQDTLVRWAAGVPELWEDLTTNEEKVAANDDRTQRVDLEALGPRKQYTYAVMDVYTDTGGILYLREQDYDSYSGTGWSNTVQRSEEFSRNSTIPWEYAGKVSVTTRRTRDVLYYPYYPQEALFFVGGCVVNTEGWAAYEVERYVLPDNWRQIAEEAASGNASPRIEFPVAGAGAVNMQRYRKLPGDTQAWAEALLDTILTDETTDTQKAEAIAAYVRDSAAYDLDTERMPEDGEDFARWFLEESDTGYCVHFATAAAVLLRAAGVESRYVTGYMAQVKAGSTVTVTAAQAHAWVEYYESALDTWILLEATPGDLTEGSGETVEATEPAASGETAPLPETVPQETGDQTVATEGTGEGEDPAEAPEKNARKGNGWWLLLPLIPGAVWLQRKLRLELRRKRMRRGGANGRALALWQEVSLYARVLKLGIPAELESLAQKAKFSQHTLTAQELKAFEGWLREAKRRLEAKPWHLRLLWKLLYAI